MNIAVISHADYPIAQPFIGGLEAHTHQLVAELTDRGHDVTLFGKAGCDTSATTQVTIFDGAALEGTNPLYERGYRHAMRRIARGSYDLIINNSLNHVPLLTHDSTMAPMITIFHTPPKANMVKALRKQTEQSNRSYIAVSAFTAHQWQKYSANEVHVVSNGIDVAHWQADLKTPKQRNAVWVGRITPEKGTHIAIQACLKAGIPLRLSGPVYDRRYYETTIVPLLKHNGVNYVGHLDHRGVNQLLMSASIALVTPVWDEPFGLVAAEAWISGTPVAALANGALPYLVNDAVGCLADADTPEALMHAMHQALTADRAACRQYALESFNVSTMVGAYLDLIPEDILEDSMEELLWQPN